MGWRILTILLRNLRCDGALLEFKTREVKEEKPKKLENQGEGVEVVEEKPKKRS